MELLCNFIKKIYIFYLIIFSRNTTMSSLILGNNSRIVLVNASFTNLNFSSKNPFLMLGEITVNNTSTLALFQNLTFINFTCTKGSTTNYLFQSFSRFAKIVVINVSILNSNFSKSTEVFLSYFFNL